MVFVKTIKKIFIQYSYGLKFNTLNVFWFNLKCSYINPQAGRQVVYGKTVDNGEGAL